MDLEAYLILLGILASMVFSLWVIFIFTPKRNKEISLGEKGGVFSKSVDLFAKGIGVIVTIIEKVFTGIFYLFILVLIVYVGYKVIQWGYGAMRSKNWTLFICESEMSDGGCRETKYELEGYKSQNECMEKGIALSEGGAFECGYDCKTKYSSLSVCEKLCGKNGCK